MPVFEVDLRLAVDHQGRVHRGQVLRDVPVALAALVRDREGVVVLLALRSRPALDLPADAEEVHLPRLLAEFRPGLLHRLLEQVPALLLVGLGRRRASVAAEGGVTGTAFGLGPEQAARLLRWSEAAAARKAARNLALGSALVYEP